MGRLRFRKKASPVLKMKRREQLIKKAQNFFIKLLILTCFAGVSYLLFPTSRAIITPELREGAVSKERVIAPFDFQILKRADELSGEREELKSRVPPVLRFDESVGPAQMARFLAFEKKVLGIAGNASIGEAEKLRRLGGLEVSLGSTARAELLKDGQRERILSYSRKSLGELFETGLVDEASEREIEDRPLLTIIRANGESAREEQELLSIISLRESLSARTKGVMQRGDAETRAAIDIVLAFAFPNLRYDKQETLRRQEDAVKVISPYKGMVLKDERIVDSNERITREHVDKLRSLRVARRERSLAMGRWHELQPALGRLFFLVMIAIIFGAYLKLHYRDLFRDNRILLLVLVVVLVVLGISALLASFSRTSEYLIPVSFAGLVLTILISDRFAISVTIFLTLLIAPLAGFGLSFVVMTLAGGVSAIYSVLRLRERRQFYRAVLFISAGYLAAIATLGFINFVPGRTILNECGWAMLNGIGSTILALVAFPLLETLFGLTTNITLLELSDLNRPLLKKLMLEAPGTYHHSLVVATLAESASESVGANSLLARVDSYYHDIGKIGKAEYFVENQTGVHSPHEKLTPAMSRLILESHIREGLELAKLEKLPRVITKAIPEHHGTTIMSFFFQKAKEADQAAKEEDYSYPGPRPTMKETAIVMLADSVEAASRALEDPTPSRLRGLVKKIVDTRVSESQLDACGLTFTELAKIKESFVSVLTGVFHGRIAYPEEFLKAQNGSVHR
ncbi:MAG: HDIG domain-containing protein [Candidatus Eisenbacteria bacterium]|nr:HDIG domain-containing protein [Candidatus Eisenbacteria bacterium]